MKQEQSRVSIRQEPFGYAIFDKDQLRHRLALPGEMEQILQSMQVNVDECEQIFLNRERPFRNDLLVAPIRVYYEITLACDLRCKICFNSSGKPRTTELSTQEVMESLHRLKEAKVLDIRFTGGEPTQRNDWYKVLEYAKQLGFAVSCNTNAAYTNLETAQLMARLNLDQVTVSLDGNEKQHDANRGKGSFARTLGNLKIMHNLGARLRINSLVTKLSLPEVPYLIQTAAELTDEINLFTPVFVGRGEGKETDFAVTESEHAEMARIVNGLKPQYPNLNILFFSQVTKATSIDDISAHKFRLKSGYPSGTTTLNITSDGGIWCGGYVPYIDPTLCLGNIKTDDLATVWQTNPKLEQMRDDAGLLMRFCQECSELIQQRCQGAKYETELERLVCPEATNPWCIHGLGPSLLAIARERYL